MTTTEMIDEKGLEAAARAKHERQRKLGSIEQVPWEQLLPIAKESAMDDARLIVEAYAAAGRAALPQDRVLAVIKTICEADGQEWEKVRMTGRDGYGNPLSRYCMMAEAVLAALGPEPEAKPVSLKKCVEALIQNRRDGMLGQVVHNWYPSNFEYGNMEAEVQAVLGAAGVDYAAGMRIVKGKA